MKSNKTLLKLKESFELKFKHLEKEFNSNNNGGKCVTTEIKLKKEKKFHSKKKDCAIVRNSAIQISELEQFIDDNHHQQETKNNFQNTINVIQEKINHQFSQLCNKEKNQTCSLSKTIFQKSYTADNHFQNKNFDKLSKIENLKNEISILKEKNENLIQMQFSNKIKFLKCENLNLNLKEKYISLQDENQIFEKKLKKVNDDKNNLLTTIAKLKESQNLEVNQYEEKFHLLHHEMQNLKNKLKKVKDEKNNFLTIIAELKENQNCG